MSPLVAFLSRQIPNLGPVTYGESLRVCCGVLAGVLITGLLSRVALGPSNLPVLVAPLGASAVLLFAVPSSQMAQPWSILGGNVVSALVGAGMARLLQLGLLSDPLLAAGLAAAVAIGAMYLLRCLHPPGGAVALTAVLGGSAIQQAGFSFAFWPVGLGSLLMLLAAFVFNNLTGRRYPHLAAPRRNLHNTADPPPSARIGVTPADVAQALRQQDEVYDVGPDDLGRLVQQAEMVAWHRQHGDVTCADIMSRDVAVATPDMPLRAAWARMRDHRIKALPVVDEARHVVGIVTQTDFMIHAGWYAEPRGLRGIASFLRRTSFRNWPLARTVDQIMTSGVQSVRPGLRITELVPVMADLGRHHLPVVDEAGHLVGIITQSDLIAALFRSRLVRTPAAA
jgi:CBS domain-containing membrane protein